ncbi:MAG: 4,5-DOPA dioxygenase extradiol [Candidatus Elarobacter sp.]
MPANRLPAVFVGHGSPMNALEDNAYTRAWAALGASMPRPRAVLAVSAHWYVPGSRVTAAPVPRTIHDFGNFPPALHQFAYPAPGDPALAARVRELLAPVVVADDLTWGLDHGAWSVLCHVFPNADIPVVQLSIDERLTPAEHYALAQRLTPLRDEGVLVVGTGNVVHNLEVFRAGAALGPPGWAERFEARIRAALAGDDVTVLVDTPQHDPDATLAVPDIDHYLPLLYVAATRRPDDALTFPTAGVEYGGISMLSARFG